MFGAYSETDVTDGSASVMLPVTSVDYVLLQQAENMGKNSPLIIHKSL